MFCFVVLLILLLVAFYIIYGSKKQEHQISQPTLMQFYKGGNFTSRNGIYTSPLLALHDAETADRINKIKSVN